MRFFYVPRAEDEGRTRDIQLGRLTLYQLSYFRVLQFLNLCLIFQERKTRVELATFSLEG